MNKFMKYMSAAAVALGATACSDYLDKEVDLTLSADQIFSKVANTRGYLANIYTYLPDEFAGFTSGQYLAASRDCMTDNATSFWSVHYYNTVLSDGYSSSSHYFASTYWTNNYAAIRACNQFLTYVREDVVGNSEKSGDDNRLYDRYRAEARFMRALFHFDLVSWFGDVILIGDDSDGNPIILDPGNEADMNQSRTAATDVLQWIADECDAIVADLPFRYSDETSNWGRINGAAAYALKSRALLYLASPLNNTSGSTDLWQKAADAAEEFIAANNADSNPYKLYTTGDTSNDYYDCFVSTPHINPEFILSRSEWTTYEIELYLAPCGFSGSANAVGRTNPTQNLVDAYETTKGLPIDEDSSYSESNPFANRDPRLDQTILHHGSTWGDALNEEERTLDMTYGSGADYQELHGGTNTGYYSKKYLNNMSFKNPTTYTHACPIFRYAEILLNAAEAYVELGNTTKAVEYAQQVRDRVGMPTWSTTTQSYLRERIRNERRVELCFENHRFFDERRWKLFEEQTMTSETSLPRYKQLWNLYGMKVDASGNYTYGSDEAHATRAFTSPKNYYFPIPYDDVANFSNMTQNEGW